MPDLNELIAMRQREVEQLFAAVVFVSPGSAVEQCAWLKPDILSDIAIKKYWQLVLDRINPNMNDDLMREIAVQSAVEIGLQSDLMKWTTWIPFGGYIPGAYAQEISRREYITRVTRMMGDLAKAVYSGDDKAARTMIESMAGQTSGKVDYLPDAQDISIQFAQIVDSGVRSVPTYIPQIDNSIGGLERQTLTILAARPSMGKTALAWQIGRNVAHANSKVLIFSLEMSAVNLWGRAACPLAGTTWRDVRAGKCDPVTIARLKQESENLAYTYGDRLRIIDSGQTTETIWKSAADYRPDLVVIDHLRLVKDKGESENKRQGYITQKMKDLSKFFGCAVLCAAQLNRLTEQRGDKRPNLSDLRDSGEIEENADVVLMIYRDEYYNPASRPQDKSDTELWVRKFRDGPRDTMMRLVYDVKGAWFS
jgi:replicative DNA helicase